MGVFDALPEGEVVRLIRQLDASQSEIKSPQTFGSSAVMTNAVYSQASADIVVPANDGRDVLVTFTPADLSFGGGLVYRLFASTNGGTSYTEVEAPQRLPVGSDHLQRWRIQYLNGNSSTAINVKYLFLCIGTGTFTASLVS